MGGPSTGSAVIGTAAAPGMCLATPVAFLPLPATQEWGEGPPSRFTLRRGRHGERGRPSVALVSPALSSRHGRRGSSGLLNRCRGRARRAGPDRPTDLDAVRGIVKTSPASGTANLTPARGRFHYPPVNANTNSRKDLWAAFTVTSWKRSDARRWFD